MMGTAGVWTLIQPSQRLSSIPPMLLLPLSGGTLLLLLLLLILMPPLLAPPHQPLEVCLPHLDTALQQPEPPQQHAVLRHELAMHRPHTLQSVLELSHLGALLGGRSTTGSATSPLGSGLETAVFLGQWLLLLLSLLELVQELLLLLKLQLQQPHLLLLSQRPSHAGNIDAIMHGTRSFVARVMHEHAQDLPIYGTCIHGEGE